VYGTGGGAVVAGGGEGGRQSSTSPRILDGGRDDLRWGPLRPAARRGILKEVDGRVMAGSTRRSCLRWEDAEAAAEASRSLASKRRLPNKGSRGGDGGGEDDESSDSVEGAVRSTWSRGGAARGGAKRVEETGGVSPDRCTNKGQS